MSSSSMTVSASAPASAVPATQTESPTSSRSSAAPRAALALERSEEALRTLFPDQPFLIRHRLTRDPAFSPQVLIALARAMGTEHNPNKKVVEGDGQPTITERALRGRDYTWLEEAHRDPRYSQLLERCTAELAKECSRRLGGIVAHGLSILVAAPGSVIPTHARPTHGVMIQIAGKSGLSIWEPRRQEVLGARAAESLALQGHTAPVPIARGLHPDWEWRLAPGQGISIPRLAPYWLVADADSDEPVIIAHLHLHSSKSRRARRIHRFNAGLRRMGLRPRTLGISPAIDWCKSVLVVVRDLVAGG